MTGLGYDRVVPPFHHLFFKQARQLEDGREGGRLFRGGEEAGGEGGGEQPKSRGVKKRQTSAGNVKGSHGNGPELRVNKDLESVPLRK